MADGPSETKVSKSETPAPEALKPRAETAASPAADKPAVQPASPALGRRRTYRPSHRATFMGLTVVAVIIAINAVIIGVVLKSQSKSNSQNNQDQVTISQASLDKLGVNRTAVGDAGVKLVVNPDAQFKGNLQAGGDVSIGGQLKLNSKLSAGDASFAKLQAGDTALQSLNVNGNSTVSNLNLRNDLTVTGVSRFQGPLVASQLVTINNNLNVSGSLSVGGVLSVQSFHTGVLVIDSSITIGGHIITRGAAPGLSAGNALGTNGTVSISGNDAAGTVAANIGVNAHGGTIATVSFRNLYGTTPHVVVSAVGGPAGSFYINRSAAGFTINVPSGLSPGGYAFDYIVHQ